MVGIREYLLSVTGAAILCGILRSINGKGIYREIIRLLCGLFLVFTVIRPLTNVKLRELEIFGDSVLDAAEQTARDGIDYGKQARARIIRDELEAYILDKASNLGVTIRAEIRLSDSEPPLPEEVTITGNLSPYARQKLSRMLEQDLAIPKENQIWKH